MASNFLDFSKIAKRYFNVTLNDHRHTRLQIATPSKGIMDSLMQFDQTTSNMTIDDMYEICATVMSNNKGGRKVTAESLAEWMGYEEMKIFLQMYLDFVKDESNRKN